MIVNPLQTLENGLRKLFDRTGSAVDKLIKKDPAAKPSVRSLTNRIAPQLQRSIDKNLHSDNRGIQCLAPNDFKILFDYNTFSQLTNAELRELKQELLQTAEDFIANRRYRNEAGLILNITYDPMNSAPTVRAAFTRQTPMSSEIETSIKPEKLGATASGRLSLRLKSVGSRVVIDRVLPRLQPSGKPLTIGRGSDNDIVIDDRSVSKFHATLAATQDGKIVLADVGSTNGTFVNNRQIRTQTVIDPGETITFGEIDVRLEI